MKLGALLKWGNFNKGVILKGWPMKFAVRHFLQWIKEAESFYENLMKSPKHF
jgi:hypothetical protein